MQQYLIKFIEWTKLKIRIHVSNVELVYFREKEIWWSSLGVNIGYEQDGKNTNFERPIIVLKKFNKDVLWVVPTTTKEKTGEYYYQFEYKKRKMWVILTQLRLISSKRLLRKIGMFPDEDFQEIKERIKRYL
jgi:mRNA interferase MazF